ADISKFRSSILLFSHSCWVNLKKAHSSSRSSQCRNGNKFSHSTPACMTSYCTSPLYANSHSCCSHRCPNPTCSKMGNFKSVQDCCPASPLLCSNYDGPYATFDQDYPSRPTPITYPTSALPSTD